MEKTCQETFGISGNTQKKEEPAVETAKQRQYRFQTSWLTEFPWAKMDSVTGKLFCTTCCEASKLHLFPESYYVRQNFITIGFNNWKHGKQTLKSHGESDQHSMAVVKLEAVSGKSIIVQVNDKARKDQEDSCVALRAIISSLQFLSEQGLAIRGHENDSGNFIRLLKLRSEDIPELKRWLQRKKPFTSGDIQNELLQLNAHAIIRNLLTEIKENQEFAIIIDETSDISGKEQLSFCIRTVNEQLEPTEYFLGLYEVKSTTADSLVAIITDIFQRFGLKFENVRAQCFDGASNMSGVHHGVAAQITRMEPRAVYIHCYAHCLNLAVQDSVRGITDVRNTMFTVHEVGTVVKGSPKM